MPRCIYCGALPAHVEAIRDKRYYYFESGKRHWKKTGEVYRCKICKRTFDNTEVIFHGYLDDSEKNELVKKLADNGMKKIADKIAANPRQIHKKSLLGKLYEDLKPIRDKKKTR